MTKEYNKIETKVKPVVQADAETGEIIEKKKLKAVVKTKPKPYKKGLMERLVVGLLGPDGVRAIGHKLNHEIVIPAVKNIVVDSITSGIQMAIYGRSEQPPTQTPGSYRPYNRYPTGGYGTTSRTNYQQAYTPAQQSTHQPPRTQARGNSVPEFVLISRAEAQNVLDGLNDMIAEFGMASVADYYDLIGMDANYTDHQWGWTNLGQARIAAVRGGYMLQMPPMEVIG